MKTGAFLCAFCFYMTADCLCQQRLQVARPLRGHLVAAGELPHIPVILLQVKLATYSPSR